MKGNLEVLVVVPIVFLIILGEAITLIPVRQPSVAERFQTDAFGKRSIRYNFSSGSLAGEFFLSAFVSNGTVSSRQVFIFSDNRYPTALVSIPAWQGIIDHITAGLSLRRYGYTAESVNADVLPIIMASIPTSVIVLPAGEIPYTIAKLGFDFMRAFMLKGGLIIWTGGIFGGFVGFPNGTLETTIPGMGNITAASAVELDVLGFNYSYSTLTGTPQLVIASHLSPVVKALQLGYTSARVGIPLQALTQHNGTVLGGYSDTNNLSSISFVRIGAGGIVIFGGGASPSYVGNSEITIGDDIATIIASDILPSSSVAFSKSIWLTPSVNVSGEIVVPSVGKFLIVVVFSGPLSQFLFDVRVYGFT